jgi:hypothetical protein
VSPTVSAAHRERVVLHTLTYGASARFLFVASALALCVGLPIFLVYALQRDQPIAHLFPLVVLFCISAFVQLRERPEIYATADGLDLKWAWGKKRHIRWQEIRSIECNSLLNMHGKRFRLSLTRGSVDVFARNDLLRAIEDLKREAEPMRE